MINNCIAVRLLATTIIMLIATSFLRAADAPVNVEILEGLPDNRSWKMDKAKVTEKYTEPAFAFVRVPVKYSPKAHALDRKAPFVVRAAARVKLPSGEYRLLIRSRSAARLFIDGKKIVELGYPKVAQNGHNPVKPEPPLVDKILNPREPGQRDKIHTIKLDGKEHEFRYEVVVGSRKTRPEIGGDFAAIAKKGEPFRLLSATPRVRLTREDWRKFVADARERHAERDTAARNKVTTEEVKFWQQRHDIARQVAKEYNAPIPPKVNSKTPVHNAIDKFIGAVMEKRGAQSKPIISDLAFLRRVTLDTVGVIPSRQSVLAFLKDEKSQRRQRAIERLLDDPRWADHWVSFWQDLLAENPGLIKPSLNNTGPFRYWLYQAMYDNLPMDRFATELIMMEGSVKQGAPAAFGLATKNDAPMAAKAHVLARAFMAVDLSCARCHDAPEHPWTQKQTFGMAAMLKRSPQKVPSTSTVKFVKGQRQPAVDVTLPAGSSVKPQWLFAKLAPTDLPMGVLRKPKDSRARLAAVVTSPRNRRFAKVIVNRVWQRYMGVGLVADVDDWNEQKTSHPELLDWLAQELIAHDYDLKHIACLIFNSHAYQRQAQAKADLVKQRLFTGPARRRMTAEQLLDSLFVAVGKKFDCEELTFDPECWQKADNCPNYGKPRRAWEFVSLSNERDRPALALPFAQGYVDLLLAFGWRDSRPGPLGERDDTLTPVQVMTLANGPLMNRLIKLTDDADITNLCLEKQPLPQLIDKVYRSALSRPPTTKETAAAVELLQKGYDTRLTNKPAAPAPLLPRAASWSHHLRPQATRMQLAAEEAARTGAPPTPKLEADWRMRMEDLVWSLLNSPEFVYVP